VPLFPKLDKLNLMIVDDDPIIRQILIEFLQSFGLKNFIEFGDGAEAFRYLLDDKNRVDLIICDWQMPKADGLTLLRGVRAHKSRSETGFIIVTSQQTDERTKILNAKKYSVDGYIVKPFRGETLREKVFQVIMSKLKPKVS
jgi:two-component system chemotaxis response regulator CheY